MKITILKSECLSTGSLNDFYNDLTKFNSNLVLSYNDTYAYIENGETELSLSEISQILTTGGGEVEEYLMAIRADVDLLTDNVPTSMPNSETFTNTVRTFENWFDSTCELWANAATIAAANQIYLLTNPLGTTKSKYLKGSEIEILYNSFGGATPSVVDRNLLPRTITQFNTETASGWTRIN